MSIKHIKIDGDKHSWVRNPIVSPRFDERSYKGQDIVHYGSRIPLQSMSLEELWKAMGTQVRKRAELGEVSVRLVEESDLAVLRTMWFDGSDPSFPRTLDDHIGYVGQVNGVTIGGVLWKPEGSNLFMHQLIANAEGRQHQVGTKLVWHTVKDLHGKGYHSLDIGVSYNPKRHGFFKQFRVEKYPIILKKPELTSVIRLTPFRKDVRRKLARRGFIDWAKHKTTFAPRGAYALLALLKHLQLQPDDEVSILKTFDGNLIPKCVTDQIEKVCKWRLREFSSKTRAVLVIHEYGVPCTDSFSPTHKVPMIEDCAWRHGPLIDSDYQIYSSSKCYPLQYGGAIHGVHIPDDKMWEYGCFDFVKKEQFVEDIEATDYGEAARIRNWQVYDRLVREDGMTPDDRVDYVAMIATGAWIPSVYMQKFESEKIANEVIERLEEFGIQAARYWGEPIIALPIHQQMTIAEVEYVFAVVRGYFNSCRDYKGV